MTDTAQPTPEQMDRARRIADDMHPVKPGHHVKSLLNNVAYKAALTAILAADQQQAELKTLAGAMAGALETLKQHRTSGFLGPDAEKSARASMRGAYRKSEKALTAFREWQGGRDDG